MKLYIVSGVDIDFVWDELPNFIDTVLPGHFVKVNLTA